MALIDISKKLEPDNIYCGDSKVLLKAIEAESISLSVWSPPYYVGKNYEKDLTFAEWKTLLKEVILFHFPIIKPGGFLIINIADILCFKDDSMPRIMAENVSRRKVDLSREEIIKVKEKHPDWNRYKLAEHFEGRRYIGIDKERKSVEIARKAAESFNDHKKESVQMELMIRDIEAVYDAG